MMPERMAKVRVIAPKSYQEQVIKELYSLKALHIKQHSKAELDIGEPLKAGEKLSELLVTARSVASHLKIKLGSHQKADTTIKEIAERLGNAQSEVISVLDRQKANEERLNAIQQAENELNILKGFGLPVEAFSGYKSLSAIIGKAKKPEGLEKKLNKLTDKYQLMISISGNYVALFIETEKKPAALELFASHEFLEIPISPGKGVPEEKLSELFEEKERLLKGQKALEQEIGKLRENWSEFISKAEGILSQELDKAEVPLKFASTKNIVIITGFVPERNYNTVKGRLERVTGGKIYIALEELEHETVPVKLRNPKPARPFEFFTRLRGLPLYDEIDPTFIVFLTFPIFFGFMLGDIGYGIATVALALFLRAKIKSARNLLTAILISGFISIIFGFAYGEFFGEEELFNYVLPHLLSRAHEINRLLIYSIIFGILHINLGLALGFINELRHHGIKSAILEKACWFFIQLGAPFLLGALGIMAFPQPIALASGASLLLGISMLAIAELKHDSTGPIKAVIESITIFSNILSYARLMAVGLASVQLALIVNEFAKEFFHQGGIMIIAGLMTLAVGHTINLMLGLLGSFLHSLRLEYVEFFTKFFKGGAESYKPFGERN